MTHTHAHGWHTDRADPTTTRYWNGQRWTNQRRWSGTEWVEVPLGPSTHAPGERPLATTLTPPRPNGSTSTTVPTAPRTSTTFNVFVAAAFMCAVGCFVPVVEIVSDAGYTEHRSLTDAQGLAALVIGAAAASLWFAWPSRRGPIRTRALWGLGAMAGVVAFVSVAVVAALGHHEEDLVVMTASRTAEPSLGLYLLVAAVVTQVVGIARAIRDRRRPAR